MSTYLFPDNTVLCNFAAVDSLDLLKAVLDGRGRWTTAVAYEAARSSRMLPPLRGLTVEGWLGNPIEISDEADVLQINRIRRIVFGGTDDKPLKHLGEAETCYIVQHWSEFQGSCWISDDKDAVRYAQRQGITTHETIDLISIATVNGDIAAPEAYALMMRMADNGRSLRLPAAAADLLR